MRYPVLKKMHAVLPYHNFFLVVALLFVLAGITPQAFAQSSDPPDDPFYKQKGVNKITEDRHLSPFQQVNESVDPFTGNLNLLHTDVILPGNGGLDLKIQRAYNSRIWGRKDTSFPGLVAFNEKSVLGIGWSFHFGRVLNPSGAGSGNRFLPNNPVVELPDGSQHPFYQDKNDFSRLISREQWIYKQTSSSPLTYQLTLTDGTIYTFPSTNQYFTWDNVTVYQVSTITSPNGNTLTFTYDANDKRLVTSITDSVGRTINFAYTTLPLGSCTGPQVNSKPLTSITVNGKVYTYAYQPLSSSTNCNLFLASATPPVGPGWSYTYKTANPGLYELDTVTYPSGAVLTYGYSDITFDTGILDIPFTVVTSKTLSGRGLTATTWNYSYSATGGTNQVTTVTQSLCKTERYTYASFGPLPEGDVNLVWKIGLLLKEEILNGATVVQTEDYTWSPSAAISNDQISNGNWNGAGGRIYDDHISVPLLSSKATTRDGKTYTTSYSNYDAYGNPQTIAEAGDANRTTTLTYFYSTSKNIVKGHPLSQAVTVGGQTFTTTYTYDANGNLTTLSKYGVTTTFGYNNGNVASRTDANNKQTTYQYSNGTVSQIVKPISGYTINRIINWEGTIARETNGRGFNADFSYDNLNRLTRITPPLETITTVTYDNIGAATWRVDKGANFTQFNVDGLGRVTSTSASGGINTATTYNVCGQKSYQSYPYVTSNIGDSFAYDVLDRVTQVSHPDGKTQIYNYASGNVAITNERGITVTYGYQGFGNPDEKRLLSVADASGTTTYTYNTVGSLTGIAHPGGLSRSFSYSTQNFLTGETHPETGSFSYVRDLVGNLSSKTDGLGTTSFTYDAINRLTFINYPGTADDTSLAYDNADNRTSASSSAAAYIYSYDGENRMTQQVVTLNGSNYTTSYSYDGQGNLINLTYPTGRIIPYTYDSANRVASLTGYVTSVLYHPSGAMASLTFANGLTATTGYDSRYRVSAINTPGILSFTYSYDGVGNATSILDGLNSAKNRSMTYDNLDRLTTASGIWGSMSFAYDAVGNRTSKTTAGGTTNYGYTSNRLSVTSGAQPDTYTYDANGNMTSIRGFTLAYDSVNRLTSVNTGVVTYTYDGDGKRVKKVNTATGKTVLFHYDRVGNVLAETDAAGTRLVEYLYVNGQLVVRIDNDTTPPVISGVAASGITMTTATITWTTDETSDSQVEYGTTTAYGSSSPLNSSLVTSHSVALTGLTPATLYHYRVKSRDAAGNLATSGDFTFTTPTPPPPGYGVNGYGTSGYGS